MGQLPIMHDNAGTYEKCPSGQLIQNFDPMWLALLQQQQEQYMHRLSRPLKKSKRPIEQYEHYVALVVDSVTGKISLRSSSNLKQVKEDILSVAVQKLDNYVREATSFGNELDEAYQNGSSVARLRQTDSGAIKPHSSNKRRRAGNDRDVSDSGSQRESIMQQRRDESDIERGNFVAYRADQKVEWKKWFNDAFRAVQQVSCRIIAKEWIKTIHPKKQSTHPYNGKNPRTGERGDSNSTKPPYWPQDVIHKEPDHINKEARTKLLVHLLMSTPHQEMSSSGDPKSDKEITAMTLKESLDQKKLERQMDQLRKKFPIVEQIIEIRSMLEQYEAGGLSPETLIQAPDYSDFNRGIKNDDDSDVAGDDALETVDELEVQGQADEDDDDDMVLASELKSEPTIAEILSCQPAENQASDKDTVPAERGSRKTLRNEVLRTAPTSIARKTPHQRLQPLERMHPQTRLPLSFDWNTFSPSLSKDERMLSPDQHMPSPHEMRQIQSSYSPLQWDPQMCSQMDMSNQFADHCIISPNSLPDMSQGAYIDGVYSSVQQHPPFPETKRSAQFPRPQKFHSGMHEPRSIPFRGGADPYEASYMMQPSQSQEMMQRAYFGM